MTALLIKLLRPIGDKPTGTLLKVDKDQLLASPLKAGTDYQARGTYTQHVLTVPVPADAPAASDAVPTPQDAPADITPSVHTPDPETSPQA